VFTQKIAHFLNASCWNYLIGHAFRPQNADCCSWRIFKKPWKSVFLMLSRTWARKPRWPWNQIQPVYFARDKLDYIGQIFPSGEKGFPFFPNIIEYSSITINQEDGSKKFHSYLILSRGRHLKRYSVISITLRYIFALLHNALTLRRNLSLQLVIALGYREPLLLLTVIALSL
jgi:hypothetical protein